MAGPYGRTLKYLRELIAAIKIGSASPSSPPLYGFASMFPYEVLTQLFTEAIHDSTRMIEDENRIFNDPTGNVFAVSLTVRAASHRSSTYRFRG